EQYGLAAFARKCRERVAHYSEVMTEQSRRLGQWMDWDNDYYTFSDTNIEYIWGFLKTVHEHGWLYKGHRSTQWCPRCGTSLSQHEQADEAGRMLPAYGEFAGFTTTEVATRVTEALRDRGILESEGTIVHRYPICWRCKTPLVFRVVDDWFISAQEIRGPMLDANSTVEWTPPQYKKSMEDRLSNMVD